MDVSEVIRQNTSQPKRHPWETTRAAIIAFLLKKKLKRSPRLILEIGSGDAYVTRHLGTVFKNARFSAFDTAYTPDVLASINNGIDNKNINYYRSAEELLINNDKADVVLLPDVLEHVEDPQRLWNFAVSDNVSVPGAFFLVTVPAFQRLFSEHDRILNHYRRYTQDELVDLFRSENIRILKSGYFFFSLLLLRWMSLKFGKSGSARWSITNWNHNRFTTSLVNFFLWTDFRFSHALSYIGIKIPGLSCYCLCQKLR